MRFRRRAAALVLAGTAALLGPYAAFGVSSTTPRTWYVDCSVGKAGTGSRSSPLSGTQAASSVALHAGDSMLFRRGTVCRGTLTPKGGGTPGSPITIGMYGSSTAALPRIDGAGSSAAIVIADQSYVTVQDLEITDTGNPTMPHRGVYFTSENQPVTGITLQNLVIHDVNGPSSTHGKNSGGIVGWALTRTGRFSNVLIADNVIHDVSRQGITVVGTTAGSRPPSTKTWKRGTTGLVIEGNTVQRVQGDGVLVLGTVGTLIDHNVVSQGNLAGYDYSNAKKRDCAAGIWAWNANATVIQYNEVSNMHFGPSTVPGALNGCDGEAFDVDYNQDGTIVQYNYSHNNDGGFLLLCAADGSRTTRPHHADVRYNLSVDDNSTFDVALCTTQTNPAVNNLTGVRVFANTIVAPTPRVTSELDESSAANFYPYYAGLLFDDNIVDATAAGAGSHPFACGNNCSHNLFYGRPSPSTATASVAANPQFTNPSQRGSGMAEASAFTLQAGSPAIGAGIEVPPGVPQPTTQDFFGNAVTNPPSIGFAS